MNSIEYDADDLSAGSRSARAGETSNVFFVPPILYGIAALHMCHCDRQARYLPVRGVSGGVAASRADARPIWSALLPYESRTRITTS
jgi:hypothetical protein